MISNNQLRTNKFLEIMLYELVKKVVEFWARFKKIGWKIRKSEPWMIKFSNHLFLDLEINDFNQCEHFLKILVYPKSNWNFVQIWDAKPLLIRLKKHSLIFKKKNQIADMVTFFNYLFEKLLQWSCFSCISIIYKFRRIGSFPHRFWSSSEF